MYVDNWDYDVVIDVYAEDDRREADETTVAR